MRAVIFVCLLCAAQGGSSKDNPAEALTSLLLSLSPDAAFKPSGLPVQSGAWSCTPARRVAAPEMRHPDYFLRIQRAEAGRLRLCVRRSNNHIYAQIVDDSKSITVAAASTMEADIRLNEEITTRNKKACFEVGKRVAKRAMEKGIDKVFYDRGHRLYHGRMAAVADGAREAGLAF
mmetsp:Transcript_85436/g.160908  ORF Transcript_85436/g.160908 Transcript_85436/m.160908 type:complete len:176 (+) Transcript_85436:95-622(+)